MKSKNTDSKNTDSKNEVQEYIKILHSKFIVTSVDKASNNFVIICKKWYLLTMMKELGINSDTLACNGNNTYNFVPDTHENIIKKHVDEIKEKFAINVPAGEQVIPNIFWNPKLHKTPYSERFIAGARLSTLKILSKYLNIALKLLKNKFERYCETIRKNSGIRVFWSIRSSDQFLSRINNTEIFSLQVFDFSTLYTNLNLNDVETSINEMIDLIFKRFKYIYINYKQ